MARARSIKPGFFKNEDLASLEPHARLLFAGLWTLADRAGRLENRPKRIKAEILPYENIDVNKLLADLDKARFIIRYEHDGKFYISIPTWELHQHPHCKEVASTIPAPVLHSAKTPCILNPEPLTLNPEPSIWNPVQSKCVLDDFSDFELAARTAGMWGSSTDGTATRFEWNRLDVFQKASALEGIEARVENGEFSDPAYLPLPQNYLSKRIWERPIRTKNGLNSDNIIDRMKREGLM